MKVTCELTELTGCQFPIRVISSVTDGKKVHLEINGAYYTVDGDDLMFAVRRAMHCCKET
jgi:hypothetical protein